MQRPKTRKYGNFRGVDFFNSEIKLYRSPNCLNMWKNYDTGIIETRPGVSLIGEFGLQINGLFFYDIVVAGTKTTKVIVHAGTKLYTWDNFPTLPTIKTEIYTGMNVRESQAFIWNNIFFIKDGINYLEYDGVDVKKVVGTIPITAREVTPLGEPVNDDNDTIYQYVNILQPKRINGFVGDGEATEYYLNARDLDPSSTFVMTATVNGITQIEGMDFTVDREKGKVTFFTTPSVPLQPGESNVFITFSKTITGSEDKILKSTILTGFDKRIFFSGNQDYPNTLFHSELDDPRYVRDTAYYTEGLDLSPIKAIVGGNDVLWVFKEPNQSNTTIFYHVPTIDNQYGKVYPSQQANISNGCVSTGINFNDDIVFFSNKGLEAINGAINSEKLLSHRSTLVDSKMTVESNYTSLKLAEYKGYLVCLINGKVYLADSRQVFTNELTGEIEYEWYYWELPNAITYLKEYNNSLFLGNATGNIYELDGDTDNGVDINSKWRLPHDNFGSDTVLKSTNKRGGVADVKPIENGKITVKCKTDNDEWKTVGTYDASKGYIVYSIKEKKFKDIQIEFSSKKMGIISATLEAYDGSYVKR